ncbi:uncharacterized protein LOC131370227 [Hemibagrus wyckioides]|uniref:uncharacterized protein LOC131370227 n=1 Tax=Hemibagrus wyckioides TaxID=337641 RepID=UPI00266B4D6B|nr:uncharacterized protein LOC131370227 [Hemibagrus wyckioides]
MRGASLMCDLAHESLRKFTPVEANYDVENWELLSIKVSLKEWRHWLEGAWFAVSGSCSRVSSVKLSYSCLFPEVRKVYCSADGDNLHFSWTYDSITRFEDNNKTLVLDKIHNEKVTCHVKNHVSRDDNSTELHKCTDLTLPILSSVCVILITLAVLAFCIYKKRQGLRTKALSQDNKELVYAVVTHMVMNRAETRPSTLQYEGVEYGTVVTSNQKKKEDEVQYGELVFNTSA